MTFAIVARCPASGSFGVAVSSSSIAVAARCAHVRSGVGAVATQNITDPRLGARALDLMQAGASAPEALERIRTSEPLIEWRQLALVDAAGRTAVYSGAETLGIHADRCASSAACAGNLLASSAVIDAMFDGFIAAQGALGERLVKAMIAARDAGGEAGPLHAAGLSIVRDVEWPIADLRIDWSESDPIAELAALWARYAPQLEDYRMRALSPGAAPRYGVPGEDTCNRPES